MQMKSVKNEVMTETPIGILSRRCILSPWTLLRKFERKLSGQMRPTKMGGGLPNKTVEELVPFRNCCVSHGQSFATLSTVKVNVLQKERSTCQTRHPLWHKSTSSTKTENNFPPVNFNSNRNTLPVATRHPLPSRRVNK
ncbi:unnamed protein product [Ixodes pacificus]